MEEVHLYKNLSEPEKPFISVLPRGNRTSRRRHHGVLVLSLSLLSVFLLAGLIGLGVHYHALAAEFSSVKADLTERLQISHNKSVSLMEERHQLNSNHAEVTKEERPHDKCPSGWTFWDCSCYKLTSMPGSWDQSREECRAGGADMVVINTPQERTFLNELTEHAFWLGLTDREEEGTWKWVDGTPLTLQYWRYNEPNDGVEGEDCAYQREENRLWNDAICKAFIWAICEKKSPSC